MFLFTFASSCGRHEAAPAGPVAAVQPVPAPTATPIPASLPSSEASVTSPPAASADPTALGPADAPVTIVEFSDFQCPFSRRAANTIREVAKRHPGKIRWVFKSFPLPFHRQAPLLHEAALAAGEWGLFWEMHDKIFADDDALDRRRLVEMAAGLGIPQGDFEPVLDSRVFSRTVEAEAAEGASLGVTATPTFFVNGFRLEGALPLEAFDYVVSRTLGLSVPIPENAPIELLLDDPEISHPFAFGPGNAAVVAKVFVDLRSPLGLKAAPVASDLVKLPAGKARFVFKCLSTGIYPDSPAAHEAAVALVRRGASFFDVWLRCARTQGTFHPGTAVAIAEDLGLGAEKALEVERELREGTHRRLIEADRSLARRLGIRGSPTLLSRGDRFDGIEGFAGFARAIESGAQGPRDRDAVQPGRAAPDRVVADGAANETADGAACGPGSLSGSLDNLLLEGAAEGTGAETTHDFGEVASGAAVVHVFEARNDGTAPWQITSSAVPSVLEIREIPREIAAGAAEPLEAMLVTGWSRGKVEAGFRLGTSEPSRPALVFRLRGVVSEEVEVVPAGGLSIRAVAGSAAEASAELRFGGNLPREVTVLGSDVPGLEVHIEPLEPARRFRVRAKLAPGAPAGARRGTIRLKTSHERVPEVVLPVDALVRPEIVVAPPMLVARDAAKPLWIRLQASRGAAFTIQAARSDLAFVRAVPVSGPPASDQRIAVRLDGSKLPRASARGEIVIAIDPAPGAPLTVRELRVPFRWEPR